MKLHWLPSNLIVGTIIAATMMLSATPALAAKKPIRLPPPGCPSDCPAPGEDRYWQLASARHVDVGNALYIYGGASAANLNLAATRNVEYAWARINDGTLAIAAKTIVNAIATGQWNTIPLNAKYPWLAANNFGNVTPQAVIQNVLNEITPTDRKALATWVQKEGITYAILELTNIFRQYAQQEEAREHGRTLPPVTIPPGWARAVFQTMAIVGTIIIASGDPIGWVFVFGAYAGNQYMNMNGMSKHLPSASQLVAYRQSRAYRREHGE